ncbi:helix-turn-helix domain-containing protein [Bacteroides sp.]
MKNLTYTFLIYFILSGSIIPKIAAKDSIITDSLTAEYIYSICTAEPQRALDLLEQAELQKTIPQYRIDNLRSIAYHNGLSMYRMALLYAQKTYHSDSIKKHPDEMLQLLDLIASQYQNIGNYKESIRHAVEGIELAQKSGDKRAEANLLLQIGTGKRELGLKEKANSDIDRAIKIQEEITQNSKDWGEIDDLIYSYGCKITYAMEDRDYQTAIHLLPAYEEQMKRLESCTDIPKGICDMRYASEYAAYACIFAKNGQPDKAKQYYQKYIKTDYAATDDGEALRIEYLLTTKQYKDALHFILKKKEKSIGQGDTVSYDYLHYVLEYEAQVYRGLGDNKALAKSYRQMYVISDSLNAREKQNAALELATIYETNEKDAQILKQSADLKQRNTVIVSLAGIMLLMLILLRYVVWHIYTVKKKNLVLVGRINELMFYKHELQKAKNKLLNLTEPSGTTNGTSEQFCPEDNAPTCQENNQRLFEQLNQTIINEKLYLNPELSRDELAQIIHVNKNRFAEILQESTGMRLTTYLNELRLNHAIQLLKEHPNHTLQAIAHDSGFSNMGTFHRLFKEKVGMTPSEYKTISETMK